MLSRIVFYLVCSRSPFSLLFPFSFPSLSFLLIVSSSALEPLPHDDPRISHTTNSNPKLLFVLADNPSSSVQTFLPNTFQSDVEATLKQYFSINIFTSPTLVRFFFILSIFVLVFT